MKLKKLSRPTHQRFWCVGRYFYRHPKSLFNGAFIFSIALHGAMLIQIPFLRFTSLPARKDEMTIINVRLQNIKVHSKTNIVKKEEEKPKERKREKVEEIVKENFEISILKEEKKEEKKEEVVQEKFLPPPPSISKDIIIKARETYEDKILKKINAMKHYPMQARRRNQEGVVQVEFTLKRDGTLKGDVTVLKKCRYEALNGAAIKTIAMANPYPTFPNEIKKDEMTFIVDVVFHLEV